MGIVVLKIVNLFSALLHLNTDFSQRRVGQPLCTTSSCHTEILTEPSLLGGGGRCCRPWAESNLLKYFEKRKVSPLDTTLIFQASGGS